MLLVPDARGFKGFSLIKRSKLQYFEQYLGRSGYRQRICMQVFTLCSASIVINYMIQRKMAL